MIGQAWTFFILAVISFLLVCGGLLTSYVTADSNYSDAKIFLIITGSFTLFFSVYSVIGFRLRRIEG